MLSFFIFSSCKENTFQISATLFDSEKYFATEASRLNSQVKQAEKTSVRNGATESEPVSVSDWKKELEPFSQCNISKPSLRNSYRTDTISGSGFQVISYNALEPQLIVRQAVITTRNDRIVKAMFATRSKNILYTISQSLVYIPDSGYSISGMQDVVMGEKTDYLVQVKWR